MNIGTLELGEGKPAALVAELSNAHNGSLDRAIRLLDAAKASGASAAKLQAYTPDELIALRGDGKPPAPWSHMTMRELYQKAMTPAEWFPGLFDHARKIGLPLFSSVFGLESLAMLESLDCPAYKCASLDFGFNTKLRSAIAKTGKPLIESTAFDVAPFSVSYPVYCPKGYPQERANLKNIKNGYFGYSYHGTNPAVPALSVAVGAKFVEVHFQLDAEPSELESAVSLNESGFRKMVLMVRGTEGYL